jgi:RNA recognition motif-containing protein
MTNSKLYVGNLAPTMSEKELGNLFGAHGLVADVKIPVDRETGHQRPFAFVTMTTAESAQAAIQALNGHFVAERALTVSEARPREERPAFNRAGTDHRRGKGGPGGRSY